MQQTYAAPVELYGGFWRRAAALIIDAFVVGIPLSIIGGIGNLNSSAGWNLVRLIVQWLYFAFLESSEYQATLGKMALGIKVTDLEGNRISFGRATGRYFAKILSAIILFIGFIMAAFTERKQALHDMIASTLVVRKEASFATAGAGAYGGASSYGAPPPPPPPSSAPPPAPPPMAPSGGFAGAAPPPAPETAEPPAPADPEAATGETPHEEGESAPG